MVAESMGVFAVDVRIARPGSRPVFRDVRNVLVDTGSEATWISSETLRGAGITVRKRNLPFVTADGRRVTRDLGYAIIRCGEFETIDEVVFAHAGDLQLLGARTLEGFNARVDARRKRLVAAGPRPAAEASIAQARQRSDSQELGAAGPLNAPRADTGAAT